MANCCSTNQQRALVDGNNEFTSLIRQRMKNIQFRKDSVDQGDRTFSTKSDVLKMYKIVKKLGSGCFSNVFLAIDTNGTMVALKMIKKKKFRR